MFVVGAMSGSILVTVLFTATGSRAVDVRREAVETGHAEYYLDENNERQWRWKGATDGTE